VGSGPRNLVCEPNTVTQYLGLDDKKELKIGEQKVIGSLCSYHLIILMLGQCVSDKKLPRPWNQTLAGKMLPHIYRAENTVFKTSSELYLQNGDKCRVGHFIIAKDPVIVGLTVVARVEEILQLKGSIADVSGMPDHLLLQAAEVNREAVSYHMLQIHLNNRWALVDFKVHLAYFM
jgi:hypothetical protein